MEKLAVLHEICASTFPDESLSCMTIFFLPATWTIFCGAMLYGVHRCVGYQKNILTDCKESSRGQVTYSENIA